MKKDGIYIVDGAERNCIEGGMTAATLIQTPRAARSSLYLLALTLLAAGNTR